MFDNLTSFDINNMTTNLYTTNIFLNLSFFIIGLCIMIRYNPLKYECDPMYIPKSFFLGIYVYIISFINLVSPSIVINQIVFITGLGIAFIYNPLQYACHPIKIPKKFLIGILICIIAIINLSINFGV